MKLKLRILAEKLKLDGHPKLNPCCQVSRIDNFGKVNRESEVVIGQTESIPNTTNPYWIKQFDVDIEEGEEGHYSFNLYHDNEANKILIVSGWDLVE